MKNALLSTCFLVLTLPVLAQTTSLAASMESPKIAATTTPSVNPDEEAIKKVAIAETDAYVKRDFKTWAACYIDAPTTSMILTPNGNPGSMMFSSDFSKVSKGMKGWMDTSPQSEMQVISRDGWMSRVNGNMAWINYDQMNLMVKTGAKIKSKELKVLEKMDGQWKISTSSTTWDFAHTEYSSPNLEEEAIKKALDNETLTFQTNPQETFSKHWVLDNRTFMMGTWNNGKFTHYDLAQLKETAKGLKPSDSKTVKANHKIAIKGNTASVDYDQVSTNSEGSKVYRHNLSILEKVNGEWKILGSCIFKTDEMPDEKTEIASKSVPNPMSPSDIAARNKATFIKVNALYNDRKFDEALKFYAPNFVRNSDKKEEGHAGVKARWEATSKMWPDHKGNIESIVAEGDWVMVRGRATATHTEVVMGVKPTSKKMEVAFWEAIRFDKDGMAVENWTMLDNFAMMQQLGLIPTGK
jgi:predicted ester cyclase